MTQAYLSGFFQATALIFVTIANYYVILVSDNILDVVMNFLSLMVISEIDDFFFKTHSEKDVGCKLVLNEDGKYD